jgi:chain length determinant protein (polysaccharide antigen chain regulator)
VSDTVNTANISHDDEIDLIELAINLWREKWIIITAVIIAAVIGVAIATNHEKGLTTSYKVGVQLSIPSFAELKRFNQTEYYTIAGDEAFKEYIDTLESNGYGITPSYNKASKQILSSMVTNAQIKNEDTLNKTIATREITYPITSIDMSSISPDTYFVSYFGNSKDSAITLSQFDLSKAKEATINNIRVQHNTALELKIHQLERADMLAKKILSDRLDTQTEFILISRKNKLERLGNALRIARANNISTQVETNINILNESTLYLRGIKLLTTDIEYLKSLNDDVSSDKEILALKKETLLLKNNRLVEQLRSMMISDAKNDTPLFYDTIPHIQAIPEKSKKKLIIIVSILLGGMIGLFIVIGRIMFKSYKKRI